MLACRIIRLAFSIFFLFLVHKCISSQQKEETDIIRSIELYNPINCLAQMVCPGVERHTVQQGHLHLAYRWTDPNMEGLQEIIFPLTSQKCLVIIENRFKVDLLRPGLNPVVVKTLQPTVSVAGETWAPDNFAPRNVTIVNEQVLCSISVLFRSTPSIFLHPCLQLNFSMFSIRSKQWFCYLQLSMYTIHGLDYNTEERATSSKVFPPVKPPTFQLFFHTTSKSEQERDRAIEMTRFDEGIYRDRCEVVLLFIIVGNATNEPIRLFQPRNAPITNVILLNFCKYK